MSLNNFENGPEDGLDRGAAHEETVQVGQSDEIFTVCLSHTTSVDYANLVGDFAPDRLAHPTADVLASFLGLICTSNCSRAYGPERLVNNYDFRPVFNMFAKG